MTDEAFLTAFENCTIEELRHRDHIKVAYLYLRCHPLDEATAKIRTGIQTLAIAWKAPTDNLEQGYHETKTVAWIRLVHIKLSSHGPAASADTFCDQHPDLTQKKYLELFYSPDRLKTWEAKQGFVEPDLTPFPQCALDKNKSRN